MTVVNVSLPSSDPAKAADEVAEQAAALSLNDEGKGKPQDLPPHRSHDPDKNQKRSDPFQFGSRFLGENDDVFEFNAWDHVETDDTYKEYAEAQIEKQRQAPASEFDKTRFNTHPAKWWDLFYKNNSANFFKDRKWLQQEFPILGDVTKEDYGPAVVLEIGAGAGNTAFPLIANSKNPHLRVHACDYSKKAVDVMRGQEAYNTEVMQADVWDVTSDELPPGLEEGSVDVAVLIFIFSALSPREWEVAVKNVHRLLKPGGHVCFRDYGRGDLAQVRFKKNRFLEENFYCRGDGTRVYFFEEDQLAQVWSDHFKVENLAMDRRMLVNRASRIKMYRCWLQGRFTKK
ncbi:probable ABP140 - actin filament-binding protein [Cephalotrichum gorgonifer]|uniref:tRNA N(3)-methylcytidine methyltransferase n=1 Tax=Cephalotrichum gorgonifer TaxID=2041049 RepID=A0AAE8MU99_9PEZI|nr:probable ABP140 - actin filament-binding protein [Cephalotrichum gorgonifer]